MGNKPNGLPSVIWKRQLAADSLPRTTPFGDLEETEFPHQLAADGAEFRGTPEMHHLLVGEGGVVASRNSTVRSGDSGCVDHECRCAMGRKPHAYGSASGLFVTQLATPHSTRAEHQDVRLRGVDQKAGYEDEETSRRAMPDGIRKERNRTGNVVDWCWSRLSCREKAEVDTTHGAQKSFRGMSVPSGREFLARRKA